MTPTVKEVQNELASLANPKIALSSQRFFKTGPGQYGEGDIFRGIRVPVLRQLSVKYQPITLSATLRLLRSSFHEDRLLALLLLVRIYSKADDETQAQIYGLYLENTRFINNWDLVDSSAEYIVGAFLFNKKRTPLYELARSNSLWERRIAIIATFHFIKRNSFQETLKVGGMLLNDSEDLIHKAVGWMLREIGKRDLGTEEKFLRKNYKRMPRVMLRYAIERFPPAQREQYLKGKI